MTTGLRGAERAPGQHLAGDWAMGGLRRKLGLCYEKVGPFSCLLPHL